MIWDEIVIFSFMRRVSGRGWLYTLHLPRSLDMETRDTEASSAAVLQCCSAAEVKQRWELRECSPPDDNESGAACSELQRCRARQQCAVFTLQYLHYLHVSIYNIYSICLVSTLDPWSTYRIYTTCTISTIFAAQYLYCTLHSIYTAVSTVSTLQLGLQQSTTLQQQHSGDQGGPEQGAGRTCRYIIQIAASIYQPRILV